MSFGTDLKGDLVVLRWASVQRVRQGSISSELLLCGGGVCGILLLPLVSRCIETIDVCIWHMFVLMSVVVTVGVCGDVCCLAGINEVFFSPWSVEVCCMLVWWM